MKLSVAMCTYNSSRYLAEQLDSVMAQSRLPDEMVICDDHSADNTVPMLKAFALRTPFPVHIQVNAENIGPNRNFAKAVNLCSGEIIVLSDADDVWYPWRLTDTALSFCDSSTGLVFGNADVIGDCPPGLTLWKAVGFTQWHRKQLARGEYLPALLRYPVVTGATVAFRAKFRHLITPVPDCWVHDGWFALVIAFLFGVKAIDKPLIQYRRHSAQKIGLSTRTPYETSIAMYREAYEYLQWMANSRQQLNWVDAIQAKIDHLTARSTLGPFPVLTVLKELLTFRYSLYSGGLKSAAKDLLA